MSDYLTATVTMIGSGVISYLIARSQGEKTAQRYLLEEQYRRAHQKSIVSETMASWRKTLSEPRKILHIEPGDGENLKVDFSPLLVNPQILYFESHLRTGYESLWMKIKTWRDSYSKLVKRTTDLAERTRRFVDECHILPRYDHLHSGEEHVHYGQLLVGYFHTVCSEIEGYREFEVELGEYMRGETKWYSLKLEDHQFAVSPSKEKILQLKRRVEEFHGLQEIQKEFRDVSDEGERLNRELKGVLEELENVWAEVYSYVQLKGSCEAGVKGQYEREQE